MDFLKAELSISADVINVDATIPNPIPRTGAFISPPPAAKPSGYPTIAPPTTAGTNNIYVQIYAFLYSFFDSKFDFKVSISCRFDINFVPKKYPSFVFEIVSANISIDLFKIDSLITIFEVTIEFFESIINLCESWQKSLFGFEKLETEYT
ncbi:MAG: hypothetical protein EAZ27_04320 [Cytophagales bacterium]|nr:MAG: hypothetical protein EAZ27_04320 [Cytophagales bacterium]